jgi:hypothetical protein
MRHKNKQQLSMENDVQKEGVAVQSALSSRKRSPRSAADQQLPMRCG